MFGAPRSPDWVRTANGLDQASGPGCGSEQQGMRTRLTTLAAGPVAGALGLAAGHLVAALTTPAASPVLAVGSAVIDRTPTAAKDWAIAHFGTHDKTILVGSVLLVVLAASVAIGPLARRRWWLGATAFVGLAGMAAVCALTRPTGRIADVVPSVVAAVVAVVALSLLVRPGSRTPEVGSGRRTVLLAGGLLGAAAVLGETGRRIITVRDRPEHITLPKPASPAPALPAGLDRQVPGITPFRTPNASFYRVDTRLDVPIVNASDWTLTVDGDVSRPFSLNFAELLAMPMIERDITLTCVSNSVGGPYVGSARWLGVPLKDILDRAGVGSRADQILSTDVGGMTISTPLALATDGRDAMIAVGMNGVPLPRAHGFPARLVVPGLYGFIGATKWVTKLTLTTYSGHRAYWTRRSWATDAPIKISSRIDVPRALDQVKAGDVVVGGVAWAQESGGVSAVEVQVDGGPWQRAQLGPSGGNDYWRQWFWRWPAAPGSHTLACRVIDGQGRPQSAVRANPFPSGSSGVESIQVTVV